MRFSWTARPLALATLGCAAHAAAEETVLDLQRTGGGLTPRQLVGCPF